MTPGTTPTNALTIYRQLARDVAAALDVPVPDLLRDDAPVLLNPTPSKTESPLYLIGAIGGKDTGKSAIINALASRPLTQVIGHGEGTQRAVAYVHAARLDDLTTLLDDTIPDQYDTVTHDIETLHDAVLIDLPDIDSHYEHHLTLTRKVLRHLLFPIWVTSIEKYADAQPRRWLARVAEGNDVSNFVFVLNKIDHVLNPYDEVALDELTADYAERIARTLQLPDPPQVWPISAIHPEQPRFQSLQTHLIRPRTQSEITDARTRATDRQISTLTRWLDDQHLSQQVQTLRQIESAGHELIDRLVIDPLRRTTVQGIIDDPAYRLSLSDTILAARVRRWPIVNILHHPLHAFTLLLRRRLDIDQQRALRSPAALIDEHMPSDEQALPTRIPVVFARLRAMYPQIDAQLATPFPESELAVARLDSRLRQRLVRTITVQRRRATKLSESILRRSSRWLLTIGAVIWFPLLQPLAQAYFAEGTWTAALAALTRYLSLTHLATQAALLTVYFLLIWCYLKYQSTQAAAHNQTAIASPDADLTLLNQITLWSRRLLTPLHATRRRFSQLNERFNQLKMQSIPDNKAQGLGWCNGQRSVSSKARNRSRLCS